MENDKPLLKTDDQSVSDEQKATQALSTFFNSHGYTGPINVLSRTQASEALKQVNAWIDTLPNQELVGDLRFKPHLHLSFVNEIVRHPSLIQAVQQSLQTPNVLLWSCDFNIKRGQSHSYFSAHQDSTYAGLQPAQKVLTAWVALSDPVSEHEGCLMFWRGSHRHGQLPHVEELADKTNMLSRGQRVVIDNSSVTIDKIPLRGGEATLHNFFTVHQSGPNQSAHSRVGLAIRYMAANVKQMGPVRETVTLISGKPIHDGFDLEPILPTNPTQQEVQRGREAHAEAMRREAANYFQGSAERNAY